MGKVGAVERVVGKACERRIQTEACIGHAEITKAPPGSAFVAQQPAAQLPPIAQLASDIHAEVDAAHAKLADLVFGAGRQLWNVVRLELQVRGEKVTPQVAERQKVLRAESR